MLDLVLVMAHLCGPPDRYDGNVHCIQFAMTEETCAALQYRSERESLSPFTVKCFPLTGKTS